MNQMMSRSVFLIACQPPVERAEGYQKTSEPIRTREKSSVVVPLPGRATQVCMIGSAPPSIRSYIEDRSHRMTDTRSTMIALHYELLAHLLLQQPCSPVPGPCTDDSVYHQWTQVSVRLHSFRTNYSVRPGFAPLVVISGRWTHKRAFHGK